MRTSSSLLPLSLFSVILIILKFEFEFELIIENLVNFSKSSTQININNLVSGSWTSVAGQSIGSSEAIKSESMQQATSSVKEFGSNNVENLMFPCIRDFEVSVRTFNWDLFIFVVEMSLKTGK